MSRWALRMLCASALSGLAAAIPCEDGSCEGNHLYCESSTCERASYLYREVGAGDEALLEAIEETILNARRGSANNEDIVNDEGLEEFAELVACRGCSASQLRLVPILVLEQGSVEEAYDEQGLPHPPEYLYRSSVHIGITYYTLPIPYILGFSNLNVAGIQSLINEEYAGSREDPGPHLAFPVVPGRRSGQWVAKATTFRSVYTRIVMAELLRKLALRPRAPASSINPFGRFQKVPTDSRVYVRVVAGDKGLRRYLREELSDEFGNALEVVDTMARGDRPILVSEFPKYEVYVTTAYTSDLTFFQDRTAVDLTRELAHTYIQRSERQEAEVHNCRSPLYTTSRFTRTDTKHIMGQSARQAATELSSGTAPPHAYEWLHRVAHSLMSHADADRYGNLVLGTAAANTHMIAFEEMAKRWLYWGRPDDDSDPPGDADKVEVCTTVMTTPTRAPRSFTSTPRYLRYVIKVWSQGRSRSPSVLADFMFDLHTTLVPPEIMNAVAMKAHDWFVKGSSNKRRRRRRSSSRAAAALSEAGGDGGSGSDGSLAALLGVTSVGNTTGAPQAALEAVYRDASFMEPLVGDFLPPPGPGAEGVAGVATTLGVDLPVVVYPAGGQPGVFAATAALQHVVALPTGVVGARNSRLLLVSDAKQPAFLYFMCDFDLGALVAGFAPLRGVGSAVVAGYVDGASGFFLSYEAGLSFVAGVLPLPQEGVVLVDVPGELRVALTGSLRVDVQVVSSGSAEGVRQVLHTRFNAQASVQVGGGAPFTALAGGGYWAGEPFVSVEVRDWVDPFGLPSGWGVTASRASLSASLGPTPRLSGWVRLFVGGSSEADGGVRVDLYGAAGGGRVALSGAVVAPLGAEGLGLPAGLGLPEDFAVYSATATLCNKQHYAAVLGRECRAGLTLSANVTLLSGSGAVNVTLGARAVGIAGTVSGMRVTERLVLGRALLAFDVDYTKPHQANATAAASQWVEGVGRLATVVRWGGGALTAIADYHAPAGDGNTTTLLAVTNYFRSLLGHSSLAGGPGADLLKAVVVRRARATFDGAAREFRFEVGLDHFGLPLLAEVTVSGGRLRLSAKVLGAQEAPLPLEQLVVLAGGHGEPNLLGLAGVSRFELTLEVGPSVPGGVQVVVRGQPVFSTPQEGEGRLPSGWPRVGVTVGRGPPSVEVSLEAAPDTSQRVFRLVDASGTRGPWLEVGYVWGGTGEASATANLPVAVCVEGCGGDVDGTVPRRDLYFEGSLGVAFNPTAQVRGDLAATGWWYRARGLPFLHAGNMRLGLDVDLATQVPTRLEAGAVVCFGNETNCRNANMDLTVRGAAYIGFSAKRVQDSYFVAMLSEVTLGKAIDILG